MIASFSKIDAMLKKRNLMLFSGIDAGVAETIVTQGVFLANKSKEPITLNICSPGGDVAAGLAIIDALNATGCTIKTLCLGQACSMAAVMLASGTKGHRYISKHSRVMLHQVSGGCYGSSPDIQVQCQAIQDTNKILVQLLAEYTHKPPDQIKADIGRDLWLDSAQALKYGIADKII